MTTELRIGGFTALTSIDYPGELAAVVFCQGCPWRCGYCQNAELIPADVPTRIPWAEIKALLRRRVGLLDAVVFSGGEPTAQGALAQALADTRALGFKTGLHSAAPYPERLQALLPLLDWVGLDIKALPGDYPAITGVAHSGETAWDSARRLVASGTDHEIRLTAHPAWLPPERAEMVVSRLRAMGAKRIVIQAGRPEHARDPDLRSLGPMPTAAYRPLAEATATVSLRL